MQERRIDDYWNIDGSRDVSDSWTGFTQFTSLEEKPPDGYMWSAERLTRKTADIQARLFMARTLDEIGKKCQAEGEAIDDYWNVDGDRQLSDTWTRFTRFTLLKEKPPDGFSWSGRRLTRKQTTSRLDKLWP